MTKRVLRFLATGLLLIASMPSSLAHADRGIDRIGHVIVIYQENWSFDALYGSMPGANGLANAGAVAAGQVDRAGVPYAVLPQPIDTNLRPPRPDKRFPADLPLRPFDTAPYVRPEDKTGDLVHRFYQQQLQIDAGKLDKQIAWSDAAGLVMGYYDASGMPEGRLARRFTLMDNFFHAAFGGSFLNAFWLVCACTPRWPDAPAAVRAQIGEDGALVKDGAVTPDGYAVNTSFTVNNPHPATATALLPNQTMPTIGDRLTDKGVGWAWYAGGWNDALAGRADPLFQFHHHPFAFFANYADGTEAKRVHLKDEQDFFADLKSGGLPPVSFVKPIGADNEHPGYASLARGQQHVGDIVDAVMASPYWADTAIIITYDEFGGRFDHVAPPSGDRWGPGMRVPTIVISPFAKRGYVDHTQYDTTSILKLIETRWGLAPLGIRDAGANDMTNAFDFGGTFGNGLISGHLSAGAQGHFAYATFQYPGDESVYTLNLQVSPDDPVLLQRAGFTVYAPGSAGNPYVKSGSQTGLKPNASANVIGRISGTYLVQIYNYDPGQAMDYTLTLVAGSRENQKP